MSFLNPFFFWLLPLAALPLLLSIFNIINRRRSDFPSLDLLKKVLERQNPAVRVLFRIRQVLRVLILTLVTTAFAQPFPGPAAEGTGQNAVAVIDGTVSMSRFDLNRVVDRLRRMYVIRTLYRGSTPMRENEKAGDREYDLDAVPFKRYLEGIPDFPGDQTLILVTDAQKADFRDIIPVPRRYRNVDVWILKKDPEVRNIGVVSASVFPLLASPEAPSEFTIQLSGDIRPSDRISVRINGTEIYSDSAKRMITFVKVLGRDILRNGLSAAEVIMTGDAFTNDDHYFFPVLTLPRPILYNDIPSRNLRKVLDTVFPNYRPAGRPESADIVFSGKVLLTNKPGAFFTEDSGPAGAILRNVLHLNPEWKDQTANGTVRSRFPVLNLLGGFSLRTRYALPSSDRTETLAESGGTPIAYAAGDTVLFPFSAVENEAVFDNSPALLLLVHETVQDRLLFRHLASPSPDAIFFDSRGLVSPYRSTAGVLREKESGRFVFRNIREESDFDSWTERELAEWIRPAPAARLRVRTVTEDGTPVRRSPPLVSFLMALALVLVLVESLA